MNMIIGGVNMISDLITPHIELKVYLSRWEKPLQVIAFVDTEEATSMLDPDIILDEQWDSHFKTFGTISKRVSSTMIITRQPIMIEFFLGELYRTKFLWF